MARRSETDHVRKVCGCAKWKECAHPWYVSYREGKEVGPSSKVRERGLRAKEPRIRRISYLTADRTFDGDSISPPGAGETR